jgi:hypothetical protein
MRTLAARSFDFRHSVGLNEVEHRLLEWEGPNDSGSETSLDLSHVRNVELGAGIRLTNAMRRWGEGRLTVRMPPEMEMKGSDWFRLFTRSGIGWALAAHAHLVSSGDRDITQDVRTYYADIEEAAAPNCVMFCNLESAALAPSQNRFISVLLAAMREHIRSAEKWVPLEVRRAIGRLAYEAVTNVIDHAFGSPWRKQGEPLSYMSLRWYKSVSASSDELGGLRSYIENHSRNLGEGEGIAGWLELVVADSGVGIAARHRQVDESVIYGGPVEDEDEALVEALKTSATVKLRALDAQLRGEPGYGTTIMAECLGKAKAYASLRTGRRLVQFDPWRHKSFELDEREFGWVPGTEVQVLLPVLDPQLHLPT